MSTISDAIIKDHRELEKCYDEVVNNPDDIDHITRYGNQFSWELARHSVAEELLLIPLSKSTWARMAMRKQSTIATSTIG